jgi:hypothetical protein
MLEVLRHQEGVRREVHAAGAVLQDVKHGAVVEITFTVAADAAEWLAA